MVFLIPKKVIVTGGAGFIGSNLVQELSSHYDVTVIDDLSTGRMENLAGISGLQFIRGSIADLSLLRQAFTDAECIFHQAALPSVQRSVNDPISSNLANVDGTLNVLVAARDCEVKKVVFASSSSVYGDTPILPKKEDMKPNPKSPYAITKLTGEYYCRIFSEIYGLHTTCLRYFNVFGPKQNPESQYAAVIPIFITRILNDMPPIIYGDGTQTRDFTFVEDVVKANILAMKSNSQGIFNIACQRRISLNELAHKIMGLTSNDLDIIYDKPRPGDVKDSLADISFAHENLGYEPDYDMDSGLRKTIKWFLEYKILNRLQSC